ncbi:MAG: hypothetical protein AB7M12_06135 [Hyphomonadaceae bacterium]
MPKSSPSAPLTSADALEILARQEDLREAAVRYVGDVNEARMLVHTVMSRAFEKYRSAAAGGVPGDLGERMRREIKALADRGDAACSAGA